MIADSTAGNGSADAGNPHIVSKCQNSGVRDALGKKGFEPETVVAAMLGGPSLFRISSDAVDEDDTGESSKVSMWLREPSGLPQ